MEELKDKDKMIDELIDKVLEISPEDGLQKITEQGLEKKERVITNDEPLRD